MGTRKQSLDGRWGFFSDTENVGQEKEFWKRSDITETVTVPGAFQEFFPYTDGVVWYYKTFENTLDVLENGRYYLNFTAVDFSARVWLNDRYVGLHEDGEEAFSFDVTDFLCKGENRLCVRVLNPYQKEIDGLDLVHTPHRNKNNNEDEIFGASINVGGIVGSVSLSVEPAVVLRDVYIRGDIQTGIATIRIETENRQADSVTGSFSVSVYPYGSDRDAVRISLEKKLPVGKHSFETQLRIENHKLWSVEDPNLYTFYTEMKVSGNAESAIQRKFGFREFKVINGFFHLNGKRLFLKSSHKGNNFPGVLNTARDLDTMRRDLVYAKTCGFNTIRSMAGMAFEEQLDFCDELGLIIYDENYAGWLLEDGPRMKEFFEKPVLYLAKRNRNHACAAMMGLLNETHYGAVFEFARTLLPKIREVNPDVLVMMSSGRWDGRPAVGSFCNPGDTEWTCGWGREGKENKNEYKVNFEWNEDTPCPYSVDMGDQHIYPRFPQTKKTTEFFLKLSEHDKPVMVSEYGYGTQPNVIQEYLKFQEAGMRTDLEDASLYKNMSAQFLAGIEKFKMDGVFPFPEDFLVASMEKGSRLRELTFDCIRSNPMICGYNVTGLLDHGWSGEGLWTYWRELKPQIAEKLREGWAPLRWGVILDDACVYPGKPNRIRVFLANEDVLKPGSYPVWFRIAGEKGVVWEKKIDLVLPESGYGNMPPLAITALDEEITVEEEGNYTFGVTMTAKGAPLGGRRSFTVKSAKCATAEVVAVGLEDKVRSFLSAHGVKCLGLSEVKKERKLILVGNLFEKETARETIVKITELVSAGCTAVYLAPQSFKKGDYNEAYLPLSTKGNCYSFYNWLYHTDILEKRHPVFAGVGGGLADCEQYGDVYPDWIFENVQVPEKALAVAYGVGMIKKGGYQEGMVLGEYRIGNGKMVLNTYRVLENVGKHPAADLMLMNFIRTYECEKAALEEDSAAKQVAISQICE